LISDRMAFVRVQAARLRGNGELELPIEFA
jgi:hypothetical protein